MSAIFQKLRDAGVLMWGEWGSWCYDTWTAHNEKYFGGKLKVGGIIWGLTPHGHFFGCYAPWNNNITLHTIIAEHGHWNISKTDSSRADLRMASDVLLHEMTHQNIHQFNIPGDSKECHNCPAWCGELMRLSIMLKLKIDARPVKRRRIPKAKGGGLTYRPFSGCMSLTEMSHFPHMNRPAGYYGDYWEARWQKVKEAEKEKGSI